MGNVRSDYRSFDSCRTSMDQLVDLGRVISCRTRLRLLQLVGERGMCLSAAAEAAGVGAPTAHYHLTELVRVGLAVKRRTGRATVYSWGSTRVAIVETAVEARGDGSAPGWANTPP